MNKDSRVKIINKIANTKSKDSFSKLIGDTLKHCLALSPTLGARLKFKDINKLVEFCLIGLGFNPDDKFLYPYLVFNYSPRILETLKRKSNKPSKYDLGIINEINNIPDKDSNHLEILKIYNNRKNIDGNK